MTRLYADGKPIILAERIGKGGEGEVYALGGSLDLAAKIFTGGNGQAREAKVTAMVRAKLADQSKLVAFPLAIARDEKGKFVGFLMRRVSGHKPLFELYAPAARKSEFPRADYRFLVAAAANIARAVASVHRSSCVIGDLNHSGILIAPDATAALIDADSFQIATEGTRYLCLVGVPEYTPPELLGAKLSSVVRTSDHDAFGLAVIVFQLLFMGRHPFVGRYAKGEMPIEKAIKEHRFAYSQRRSVGMSPPPGASNLGDLPPALRNAFEIAFGPHSGGRRASAEEWVDLLSQLNATLRVCAVNRQHHFSSAAPECPWCRMERALGIVLFLAPELVFDQGDGHGFDPSEAGFNLVAIWAAIEAVKPPALPPSPLLPQTSVKPSAEVRAALRRRFRRRASGVVLALMGGAVAVGAAGYWVVWLGMVLAGLAMAFGQIDEDESFARKYVDAAQALDSAHLAWRSRVGTAAFEKLRQDLWSARKRYESLPEQERAKVAALESQRKTKQKEAFLERFLIRNTDIHGIGQARRDLLASYGIETAAHVTPERVLQVPGFGLINSKPLLEWRRQREKQFVYSPQQSAADLAALRGIKIKLAAEARELRQILAAGPNGLAKASAEIARRAGQPDPDLLRRHALKQQAEADLVALGISVPLVPSLAPPPTHSAPSQSAPPSAGPALKSKTAIQPGGHGMPSCPQCGGSMRRRTARRGSNTGRQFWGCATYPRCRGTRPI